MNHNPEIHNLKLVITENIIHQSIQTGKSLKDLCTYVYCQCKKKHLEIGFNLSSFQVFYNQIRKFKNSFSHEINF